MTTKIAVSLPDHLVEEARAAVREGRAASVSAYVADALAAVSPKRDLGEILNEIFDEIGHPTPEERAWARRALGIEDDE